tara:strand:- start:183 stop:515 length:333 start_codon:yes stop_codon:yes gene_type:complete
MKKEFLKVFVGSRGILEEVEVVETSYKSLMEFYDEEFYELGLEVGEEYVDEWCSFEKDEVKGLVSVGLNEEEGVWFVDMELNKEFCDEILVLDKDDKDGEVVERMWEFVG